MLMLKTNLKNLCVPEMHSFPVGWVFTKNFPEGRLHPPLSISCSLLITTFQGSHLRPAQEPRQKKACDKPQMEQRLVPYLLVGDSPSGEGTAAIQLLAAICCPLQGEKSGQCWLDTQAHPHSAQVPQAGPCSSLAEPL